MPIENHSCSFWTRNLLLAVFAAMLMLVGALGVPEARAVGMTGHETISWMVQQKAGGSLRELLDAEQNSYRNGTIFPDVANRYLTGTVKWSGSDSADDLSHGEQDGKPRGFINEYLKVIADRCGRKYKKDETTACKRARAFFLGYLSHVVADGPWHADYIGLAKTQSGIVSVKDHCKGSDSSAHNFADTDVDICLSKQLNNGKEDVELNPLKEKAIRTRKNTRVGQGCPEHQWWHVGGGDGLLGACFKCAEHYHHDGGKLPNENGVCYRPQKISCGKIKVDDLGIDVGYLRRISLTASALSFPMVEDGYGYAAVAYNNMNSGSRTKGIGDKTSKKGLMAAAESNEFMPNLTFSHMAKKTDFHSRGYARDCKWGLEHVVQHPGGLKASAAAAEVFIAKVWHHLQSNEDFSILRFGAYNYAIQRNDAIEHCVTKDPTKACP